MASAYIKDDQGGTFIPASQRPDGTWRKPRRVKDGYIPQEEVPLYESKGKQFVKNKPNCPVGLTPEFVAAEKAKKEAQSVKNLIPGLVIQNITKKKKKKNKSKAVEAIADELDKTSISDSTSSSEQKRSEKQSTQTINSVAKENPKENEVTPTKIDPLKRLNRLRKKIREIETLAQKIKNGDIKNPDREMLDKVSKKLQIEKEIKQLEKETNS